MKAGAAATRKADATKAASEAKLALEPVSIYISRATQKLYVRRNTHKRWPDGGEVFDATIEVPVTIRNPDKPIGTHVFTAMARNDAGLRWTAVTIDNGDDAKDALDRKDYEQSAKLFDEVERQHPYSVWARRAQLMSAFCYYQANKYDDAINTADQFIQQRSRRRGFALQIGFAREDALVIAADRIQRQTPGIPFAANGALH